MTAIVRACVVALALASTAVAAGTASQRDIEEALTCQCGCGLTVHSCNHIQCPSGEPIKKEIGERLAKGEDRETILAAFKTRYGEKVLSAPTFAGFNWFAWITPFAALFVAGTVLTFVIRRRTHAAVEVLAPTAPPAAGSAALRDRLAKDLAAMDDDA